MHVKVRRYLLMCLVVEPQSRASHGFDKAVLLLFTSWHDIAVTDITLGHDDRADSAPVSKRAGRGGGAPADHPKPVQLPSKEVAKL
jgi:hypothetical protein